MPALYCDIMRVSGIVRALPLLAGLYSTSAYSNTGADTSNQISGLTSVEEGFQSLFQRTQAQVSLFLRVEREIASLENQRNNLRILESSAVQPFGIFNSRKYTCGDIRGHYWIIPSEVDFSSEHLFDIKTVFEGSIQGVPYEVTIAVNREGECNREASTRMSGTYQGHFFQYDILSTQTTPLEENRTFISDSDLELILYQVQEQVLRNENELRRIESTVRPQLMVLDDEIIAQLVQKDTLTREEFDLLRYSVREFLQYYRVLAERGIHYSAQGQEFKETSDRTLSPYQTYNTRHGVCDELALLFISFFLEDELELYYVNTIDIESHEGHAYAIFIDNSDTRVGGIVNQDQPPLIVFDVKPLTPKDIMVVSEDGFSYDENSTSAIVHFNGGGEWIYEDVNLSTWMERRLGY
jgi:hypothetical protein